MGLDAGRPAAPRAPAGMTPDSPRSNVRHCPTHPAQDLRNRVGLCRAAHRPICRNCEIHRAHPHDARALQAPVHARRGKGQSGTPARNLTRGAVHHGVLWLIPVGESLSIRTDEVMPCAAESTTLATVDLVRQMEQAGIEPTANSVLKTRKSMRTVVVLPDAAGRLLEIAGERRAAGSEWLADRGDGLPMNRGMCNHGWKKWCAAEGIERIPWSNLRNSWRTICEMVLHMPWDLMEMLMGHSLPGVSGRHYIRPSREQVARSVLTHLG